MATDAPRRRLPAAARRVLIVDAALDEFAAYGYEGASMGRIGQAAGISRSVLYDHFPSKRALFVALLQAKHADLLSHLREAIVANASSEQRTRASFDALFAFAEHESQAWKLLFPSHAPVDAAVAADYRRVRAEANRLLAELIAPQARRAGFDPDSPVAQAVFATQQAALHGAVRWWHSHPNVTRAQLVEAAMALMWTGMGGLEQRGS